VAIISDGNLKAEFHTKDKGEIRYLATAFNAMTESLRAVITKVILSSDKLVASSEQSSVISELSAEMSGQIADSAMEVSRGCEIQLVAADETLSTVEQISSAINLVSINTDKVTSFSEKTVASARDGGDAIGTAINQMNAIEKTVANSEQVIAKLGDGSKEIGQIVVTISGLASQTNLLALNAAIEAARAGEQGRGFAVVAEEVRKLAEQSHDAAEKIAVLIHNIQSDTENAVSSMSAGTHEVRIGIDVVNKAGSKFEEIAALIHEVSEQITHISSSIHGISDGSDKITTSVRKIDELSKNANQRVQEVSAAVKEQSGATQEIAASSQDLAKLARELRESVSKFKI